MTKVKCHTSSDVYEESRLFSCQIVKDCKNTETINVVSYHMKEGGTDIIFHIH